MNSRTSSYSSDVHQQPPRRPTLTNRLSTAFSTAESGDLSDEPGVAAEHQIEEEIAEIKRYEVRTVSAVRCCVMSQATPTLTMRANTTGLHNYRYNTIMRPRRDDPA